MNTFRNAFISVPALLIELKTKVKIHFNPGDLTKVDYCRFWVIADE